MKPIKNCTEHPSSKYNPRQYIFTALLSVRGDWGMFLLTEGDVSRIQPIKAAYTNLGDPYQKLARFYFMLDGEEESMDINLRDLVHLTGMCSTMSFFLPLDKELNAYVLSHKEEE